MSSAWRLNVLLVVSVTGMASTVSPASATVKFYGSGVNALRVLPDSARTGFATPAIAADAGECRFTPIRGRAPVDLRSIPAQGPAILAIDTLAIYGDGLVTEVPEPYSIRLLALGILIMLIARLLIKRFHA